MASKTLNIMIASVLSLVFLISFASATITLSSISDLSQTGSSFTFTVSSNANETINFSSTNVGAITFVTPSDITYNTLNGAQTVTINYTVPSNFEFDFKEDYSTTLSVQGTTSPKVTRKVSFEDSDFCEYSNPGELRVKIEDIKVISGFGDDDEWLPFDEIEVEINVDNKGDENVDNINIEWGLYNSESDVWTIEIDDLKDFDLKDGKDENVIITFEIDDNMDQDLEDLDEGTYILYVRATGEVDDSSNSDTCASDSENAKIFIERDFAIVSEVEIQDIAQCGSNVLISGDVWNVGERDQDDVYITVVNKDLGLNQKVEVGDINAFDKEGFTLDFNLAKDLEEKDYYLVFTVYDEDDDVYENDYDDQSAVKDVVLKVKGNCAVAEVGISAVLQSGGQAGQPLVVKASLVNPGEKATTYMLNAASYTEWASSASLEATSFTLAPGATKDVIITLQVKEDAVGTHMFNLEVLADGELIANQPVQVTIEETGANFKLPSFSEGNWHLWAIGALNVLLVILIIIIAVRIARK